MDDKTRQLFEAMRAAPLHGKDTLRASGVVGNRSGTKANGYWAAPGTGPEGETCRTCASFVRRRMSKTYLKCRRMQQFWTGGPGTDIRAKSPACKGWEKRDGEVAEE